MRTWINAIKNFDMASQTFFPYFSTLLSYGNIHIFSLLCATTDKLDKLTTSN